MLTRRSLLVAAAASPVAAAVTSIPASAGLRLSSEEDDPGYRAYCILMGDDKKIRVFLDGVEVKKCCTADEGSGYVKRPVITPAGNIAHDGENILFEEVYGDVRIEIE